MSVLTGNVENTDRIKYDLVPYKPTYISFSGATILTKPYQEKQLNSISNQIKTLNTGSINFGGSL